MKVLFAVSNENISSAIIKRYPKDYREILSYKNVYYFNAILKEIQKDKSYDRIVISEDLEPFVNTNHDSIDNFIFEHLDRISDEAHDNQGKETSIILICSERRAPGSSILNKLFSIGIYNAVMGKDRNLTELCKLINRPRTKKEAKIYYRIEQANYDPVIENEVNEVEIQNILAHFKKLGKNTERYADSFNNIAAQYTDEQLKVIINVLPIKVKAVLETDSIKYQSLMGTTGNADAINANQDTGISINTIGKTGNISGPIVIPTGVKKNQPRQVTTNATQVQRQVTSQPIQQMPNQAQQIAQPRVRQSANQGASLNQRVSKSVQPATTPKPAQVQRPINQQQARQIQTINRVQNSQPVNRQQLINKQTQQKKVVQQPAKAQETNQVQSVAPAKTEVPKVAVEEKPKRGRGRPRKNPIVQEPQVEEKTLEQNDNIMMPGLEEIPEETVMPGFEDTQIDDNTMMPGFEETTDDGLLPGFDDQQDEDDMLPGFEEEAGDDMLPGMEEIPEEEPIMPGLDEMSAEEDTLPGFEDTQVDDNTMMPGFEETTDDGLLPGFDDQQDEDDVLPGMEESNETYDNNLLGMNEDEEGEEVDVDSLLSDLDINEEINSLPDLDSSSNDNNISEDDNNMMPGFEDLPEEEPIIPGIDETEETILPGMGFDDIQSNDVDGNNNYDNYNNYDNNYNNNNYNNNNYNNNNNNNSNYNNYNSYNNYGSQEPEQSEVVDTVKPKINYSMSNLNSLLTKDKKIVTFIGTTKNGTSFLVNNLALMFSSTGIDTAILDMTENRNSYYIFTDSREELRNIAYTSIGKLENGYAEGIKINKNFTVYTALPADGNKYENAEPILSTLVQNHSLVLIDCDFQTPPAYFASSQEIYLVQSMDILTIQPLTAFLRELKFKGAWEPEKARVVINKETKIKALNEKMIIAGMSRYNGPDMSVMTDLFNKDMVKACSIPFDESVYAKYLETMATCKLSLSGYSKPFLQKMKVLQDMVYPRLGSQKAYSPMDNANNPSMNNNNVFSNNMNNTLNQMKNKF